MGEFRRKAREALKGNWLNAALIVFIAGLIQSMLQPNFRGVLGLTLLRNVEKLKFISILQIILMICVVLIIPLIAYGLQVSMIKIKKGEKVDTFDFIKIGFKNWI